MIESAKKLASELKLHGVLHSLERRCHEASEHSHTPAEIIRILLEDEKLARKNAHSSRLLKRAKFRSRCDLESWDSSVVRGLTKAKLRELANGSFHDRRENLLILGPTGVGKTHLAIALGHSLCRRQIAVAFHSVNLLFEHLQAEKACGKYLAALKAFIKIDTVILDDFGLRNYTHPEAQMLLEILEERYAKGSTIITSQVEPQGWRALFEDAIIADAVVDRMENPSCRIVLTGDSYRKKARQN